MRGGETLISDGPFAETKELMVGYDMLDCADLDEAIEVASKHLPTPLADHFEEHLDHFLAVVYFVPELVAALVGGVVATCLPSRVLTRGPKIVREESTVFIG